MALPPLAKSRAAAESLSADYMYALWWTALVQGASMTNMDSTLLIQGWGRLERRQIAHTPSCAQRVSGPSNSLLSQTYRSPGTREDKQGVK